LQPLDKVVEQLLAIAAIVWVGVLTAYWYRRDTTAHNVAWSKWWLIGFVFTVTSIPAFAIYFFRTRPLGRAYVAFAGLIGISVLCVAVMLITAYSIWGFVA
jgi:hypothetical protein